MDVPASNTKTMRILVNTNIPLKRPDDAVRQTAGPGLVELSTISSA